MSRFCFASYFCSRCQISTAKISFKIYAKFVFLTRIDFVFYLGMRLICENKIDFKQALKSLILCTQSVDCSSSRSKINYHCGNKCVQQHEQACDSGNEDPNKAFSQNWIQDFPIPTILGIFRSRLFQDPENFNHEDGERCEETEQQPIVEHFQISSFSHGFYNALVDSVHDQHDSQG